MRHDDQTSGLASEPPAVSPDLLDQYLAGACTADAERDVERLLETDPIAAELVQTIRAGGAPVDAARLRRKIAERIREDDGKELHGVPSRTGVFSPIPGHSRRWGWVAAVAVAVVTTWSLTRNFGSTPTIVATKSYATVAGQRAHLTLDDGTRVTLAPQTTLRIVQRSDRSRTATLEGEGYFNVTPSSDAAFTVIAGHTVTRVLGTTFAVRHYRNDSHVRVVVVTGKVSVTGEGARRPSLLLTAGLVGDITDSSAVSGSAADLAPYTGWVDDQLVFRNAPVSEVLAALSRWYGYEFRMTDSSLKERHLTAGISTESSQEALTTLKLLLHVDMMFNGSVVTLAPRSSRMVPRVKTGVEPIVMAREPEVGR